MTGSTTVTNGSQGPENHLAWDDIFGSLDARTISRDDRRKFLESRYESAMGDREYWVSSGGEESMWTWDAAVDAFIDGNWVAVILCCQATCERLLAGRFTPFQMLESEAPARWEMMGMGRLLTELESREAIAHDLAVELRRLVEYRKPWGHWKSVNDPASAYRRVQNVLRENPGIDGEEAILRLVVADATHAVETTIELLYGVS